MLFPITFSIPEEKLSKEVLPKTKILSIIVPGEAYSFDNELDYYNEYKSSYFAITKKKDGWDCLRHYEILANNCIPYFLDIENCPKNTMCLLPKDLFIEANKLYDSTFKNKNIKDLTYLEINKYNILLKQLTEFLHKNLTTHKMALHILTNIIQSGMSIDKILFLSGQTYPDYLRCLTLHGFKKLYGSNCHDYPMIKHIYKSQNIDYSNLYGRGMTYTKLLEPNLRNEKLDNTIEENIKNKYYDIIIYGSYHRGMPYYDLVYNIYKPHEIILLCGEDTHVCNNNEFLKKGHHVFVREP